MGYRTGPVLRSAGIALAAVTIVAVGVTFWFGYGAKGSGPDEVNTRTEAVTLVGSNGLALPAKTIEMLKLKVARADTPTKPRQLELSGSLGLDTNLLARVHTRFAGEVMELGDVPSEEPSDATKFRPVDFGDRVDKNQLLAVLWSKDLGEKKSELVGAIAQQRLHEETVKKLEKYRDAVPERSIREAVIAVEADIVAVERARRTLRSWMLTDDEIKAIEGEAERIWERRGKRVPQDEKDWGAWKCERLSPESSWSETSRRAISSIPPPTCLRWPT
jgi:hypothetical protein